MIDLTWSLSDRFHDVVEMETLGGRKEEKGDLIPLLVPRLAIFNRDPSLVDDANA